VDLRSLPSRAGASPRKFLIALAALLISSVVAVGSGANFNSSSANPSTLITTGSIVIVDSLAGQSVLSLSAIDPGTTHSGSVDVKNGGNVPTAFTLAQANLANVPAASPLSSKLMLQVQDMGDPACITSCPAAATVYTGTLGSMGTIALGTFAAGATHRYTFSVTFPDGGPNGGDNAYGGATTTLDYRWTATQ
jgi:spore coat-associated protein N